jgi:hypothetical protein
VKNPVGKGRISCPSGSHTAADKSGNQQHEESDDQQPEADVVHPREGHVRRPDHQRHEPVTKAPDGAGHDHEKDHDKAMRRQQHVIELEVLNVLDTRLKELKAKIPRHSPADYCRKQSDKHVDGSDVLVVGRAEPPRKEARVMIVMVVVMGVSCVSHFTSLSSNLYMDDQRVMPASAALGSSDAYFA